MQYYRQLHQVDLTLTTSLILVLPIPHFYAVHPTGISYRRGATDKVLSPACRLKQAELEEKCRFKPGVISCAEKGGNIKRNTRITIARALNIEPSELTVLPDNWKTEPVDEVEKLHLDFKNKRSANRRARKSEHKKKNTNRKMIHKEEFGGYF